MKLRGQKTWAFVIGFLGISLSAWAGAASIESATQLENHGDWQGALKEYQQIVQGGYKDYVVMLNLGRLESWQKDFAKAEFYYCQAQQFAVTPDEKMWADFGLGETLEWEGYIDAAKTLYQPWVSQSATNPEPLYRLGQLELWQNHVGKAQSLFERNLKQFPTHVPTRLGLAAVLMQEEHYRTAFDIYNDLLKVENENPQVWLGVIQAYQWHGELLKAKAMAAEAAKRFPNNPVLANATLEIGASLNRQPVISKNDKVMFDQWSKENTLEYTPKVSLQSMYTGHTEAGSVDQKLIFQKLDNTLTVYPNAHSQVFVGFEPDMLQSGGNVKNEQRYLYTAGGGYEWNDHVWTGGSLTLPEFSNLGPMPILGTAEMAFRPNDWWQPSLTFQRSMVDESLLSAAGLRPVAGPFAGNIVGRVVYNEWAFNNALLLPEEFRGTIRGAIGFDSAEQLPDNFFMKLDYSLFHDLFKTFLPRWTSTYYGGYEGSLWHYADDRLGQGGAYLQSVPFGSDGISTAPTATIEGTGGYFSPDKYLLQDFRIGNRGELFLGRLKYNLSGFAGYQDISRFGGNFTWGLQLTSELRLTHTVGAMLGAYYSKAKPFDQYTLYAGLVKHI